MVYRLGKRASWLEHNRRFLSALATAVLFAGTLSTSFIKPTLADSLPHKRSPARHTPPGSVLSKSAAAKAAAAAVAAQAAKAQQEAEAGAVSTSDGSVRTLGCNVFPAAHSGLASAASSELRKVAQYEQLCGGAAVARSSFFAPTPSTTAEARSYAADMVASLKEYAKAGVAPMVFLEPDSATGAYMDLGQYAAGAYDGALDTYFAAIKSAGITDSMMGLWVLIPEGNIPVWPSVNPATFAGVVTKVATFQKKYFPTSQAAIMLDSETYPSATSWSNGAYVSLLPYVQGIPKGLLDSFGLQGFPWAPPANEGGDALYNPKTYLRTDLAAAAARALGVTNIWLNTGTFSQTYTNSAGRTVTVSPAARQTMLVGVVALAKGLQGQGFSVDVHLFAQNKAATAEAIDWSYWKTQPGDTADTAVLTTFIHDLATAGIPLWLFDTF